MNKPSFLRLLAPFSLAAFLFFPHKGALGAGDEVDFLVQLTPRAQTNLSSELSARIDQLAFKEGESFRRSDVLVKFECSINEAKLASANADVQSATAKLEVAERLLEFKSISILEVDLEKAALAKALAELRAETAIVSKCSLKAPFNGKISELKVFNHQFVNRGDPLLHIIDDSGLEVEFLANSSWLSWLKPGLELDVVVAETQTTHTVTITRIGAKVDPVSHSIKIVGVINDRPQYLVVGMTGRIVYRPSVGQ